MKSFGLSARSFALASFLSVSLAGGLAAGMLAPSRAEAGIDVDESYFYVSLSSYGSWIQDAQFGWVWSPGGVGVGWRPYSVGHWAWTADGDWLWVSAEPFGWATYHYGRWYMDPVYGWLWMPGRVWAPAWVSWRTSNLYVGWAPLAPWGYWDVYLGRYRDYDRWHYDHDWDHHDHDWDHHDHDWDHDRDHGGGHDHDRADDRERGRRPRTDRDDPGQWSFIPKKDFDGGRVDRVGTRGDRVPDVYRESKPLPPPSEDQEKQGRGVTRGIDRGTIERAAGRQLKPVRIEDTDKAAEAGKRGDGAGGEDSVHVFRPRVNERKPDATPDRLGVAKQPKGGKDGGRDQAGDAPRAPSRDDRPQRMEPRRNEPGSDAGAGRGQMGKDRGNGGGRVEEPRGWNRQPEQPSTPSQERSQGMWNRQAPREEPRDQPQRGWGRPAEPPSNPSGERSQGMWNRPAPPEEPRDQPQRGWGRPAERPSEPSYEPRPAPPVRESPPSYAPPAPRAPSRGGFGDDSPRSGSGGGGFGGGSPGGSFGGGSPAEAPRGGSHGGSSPSPSPPKAPSGGDGGSSPSSGKSGHGRH